MSSAEVFWGLLPAAVAVWGLRISVRSFLGSPTIAQGLLGLTATVAYVGSLLVLAQMIIYRMLPSLIPHIAIAIALAVSLLQALIAEPPRTARRSDAEPHAAADPTRRDGGKR